MKLTALPLATVFLINLLTLLNTAQAQPGGVPPGLIEAPPCSDQLAHFPSQAKVPCNGIVLFNPDVSPEDRAAVVEQAGGVEQMQFHNIPGVAVHFSTLQSLQGVLGNDKVVDVIPDRPVQALAKPGTGGG